MDGWDGGDPWGSAMTAAWSVAEVATALGDCEVTATLDVSWGAGGAPTLDEIREASADRADYAGDITFETCALVEGYDAGEVTVDDLRFAARVLSRYLDLCKRAGLDY